MTAEAQTFIAEFLSTLELREQRLLNWGFYEVDFTADEALAGLEAEEPALLASWPPSAWRGDMRRLLDEMHDTGLLHAPASGRYRTRFAETVRLLSNLRQMFRYGDWATGAPLVSDIKMHLTPRRYPRQDQKASECWSDLATSAAAPGLQEPLFHALVRGRTGAPLTFAAFQRRAFSRVLGSYGRGGVSGTVVSAGTGAGKTKAFYVPALLGVAADIAQTAAPFTKVIAVYPRNVLLADQLREAISEASKMKDVLAASGLRPVTFGALLGDTPSDRDFERGPDGRYRIEGYQKTNWHRAGAGFVVPFLKSPVSAERALCWRDADRTAGRTTLYREGEQVPDVPDGVLRITRDQLQRDPPDVLFLSLEMLNRELGNPRYWATFGVRRPTNRAPRLLLLDEVHAYEGLKGAQAAWVLRRWMYWVRPKDLHVVGLSATLRDAADHLARVSGVSRTSVAEVAPAREDLLAEGMEYNLAIKGDPASGASLLSTSIQCAMLLARCQTPRSVAADPRPCAGRNFYSSKVFGFSDNLDVLNRWFHDLRDAERMRLARLRLPPAQRQPPTRVSAGTLRGMRDAGQLWELPVALQYDLSTSLRVTRCSSQDPGVDAASDVIVATSSLEVGFDDPEVAGTLHHKAPRSTSSFIQRKGRAGRRRGVRPWTVVVLSDYGADRWAFQHAERLFAPELDGIALPMTNPFVLRVHATYFLIDWIGHQIQHGSPFRYLAGPSGEASAREKAKEILRDMVALGPAWQQFRAALREVLRHPRGRGAESMSEATFDAVLWDLPRPLLTRAIPSLLRKLEANWALAKPETGVEDQGTNRPLPLFLPHATFGELDTSDVRIVFDGVAKGDEHLPVTRVLFEACPGRVSKRYATGPREVGYWLRGSKQLRGGAVRMSVRELVPEVLLLEAVDGIQVYQPTVMRLEARPDPVLDTSHGAWAWRSLLCPTGSGRPLPVLDGGAWSGAISACEAHVHRDHSSIAVLRWARDCEYEIRQRQADPMVGSVELVATEDDGESPQALGFRQHVDGILVRVRSEHLAHVPEPDADLLATLRPAFFHHLVSEALRGTANAFLVERICQTSLVALSATAARHHCSLEEAQRMLQGRRTAAAKRVLATIFPGSGTGDDDDALNGRIPQRVLALWEDPTVVAAVERAERCLWEPPSELMREWLRRRYVATLAEALRTAAVAGLDEVGEDDLAVDVMWRAEGGPEIYLTETGPGGLGHIEAVILRLRAEPDRFHDALEHALKHCPRQETADLLRHAASVAVAPGGDVERAFAAVRAARGYAAIEAARGELEGALTQAGITVTRAAMVTIVMRLLRAGSSRDTDVFSYLLDGGWRRAVRRLGVDVDPRVVAYVCSRSLPIARRLKEFLTGLSGEAPSDDQVETVVQQLLFGSCPDSCRDCLDAPGRYNSLGGRPHRHLAWRWLGLETPEVSASGHAQAWLARVREHLSRAGTVRVRAEAEQIPAVAAAIQGLLAEEIEVGHLWIPVCVMRVDRDARGWTVTLRLREAAGG